MSDRTDRGGSAADSGEAGSGTVPGDVIGAGGVTGGTDTFGTPGAPPRSEALGTQPRGAEAAGGAEPEGERLPGAASSRTAQGGAVTPEARWGVTSGSPSGGTAGGTPAQEVLERAGEE